MTSPSTNRRYGLNSNVAIKTPVVAATTGNITLTGLQTIDGIPVASGDRVLVKSQTDSTKNGIYTADTGDWSRDIDFDGARDIVQGTMVLVVGGTVAGKSVWEVSTANPVVGSALAFTLVGVLSTAAFALKGDNADITQLDALAGPSLGVHPVRACDSQTQTATAVTATGSAPSFDISPLVYIFLPYANNARFRVKFNSNGNGSDTLTFYGGGVQNIKQRDSFGTKVAPVIKSGMLVDMEFDGTDWMILNPLPTSHTKVGTFSHANNSAGAQAITGLGFKPRTLIIIGDSAAVTGHSWSVSFTDGTTSYGLYSWSNGGTMTSAVASPCFTFESAGVYAYGTAITLDADGFTVTWAVSGAPANTANYYYLAAS